MPKLTGLWRHPDFLKLWAGQTLSALSSNVTDLALPLIAALVLHASAFEEADVMADGLGDVWTTLPPPLQVAVEEAWSAYCAGSLPHGAVITDAQGRVLARGRNRVYEQEAGGASRPLYGHPLAHAEVNALLALDYASVDVRSCVLYATTEPCPLCTGALLMAGVRELRYAARDNYGGATSWLASPMALVTSRQIRVVGPEQLSSWSSRPRRFCTSRQIRVVGPEQPTLEAILMALRVEFLLRHGANTESAVLLAEVPPHAAQLAETLFGAGELERLRARGGTAAEMVRRLAAMLPAADSGRPALSHGQGFAPARTADQVE